MYIQIFTDFSNKYLSYMFQPAVALTLDLGTQEYQDDLKFHLSYILKNGWRVNNITHCNNEEIKGKYRYIWIISYSLAIFY